MGLGGRDLEGPDEGQQEGSEETILAGADRTQQRMGKMSLRKGKGEGTGTQMPGGQLGLI